MQMLTNIPFYDFGKIMRMLCLNVNLNILKQVITFKKWKINIQLKHFRKKKHSMNDVNSVFVLTFENIIKDHITLNEHSINAPGRAVVITLRGPCQNFWERSLL